MLARVLAGGGLAAAVAASTCCVLPLSLEAIGVGGARISTLSILAPYQTAFRVLAILLLGAAFWLVYGRRTGAGREAVCAAAPPQRATKAAFWVGAAVMGLVLSSGWWQRLIA